MTHFENRAPSVQLVPQPTVDLGSFTAGDFDRGRSKWVEAVWWLAKLTVIQTGFPWPSKVRRKVLMIFGANIGTGFYIRPRVNIHFPWKLDIGDNVWIGEGCTLLNLERIVIGDNAALAHEVYVSTGNHNISARNFGYENSPVQIGSYSWLGTRSFIGAGACVGEGAVVAAGAVVTGDVPPWTVVGGVPAKFLKKRILKG